MLELVHAAARGAFPPEDGRTEVVAAVAGAPAAVLSFTAHHVVAADVPAGEVLARVDPQDLKGPLAPGVLAWLAERTGLVAGSLDVVLAWVSERTAGEGCSVREAEPGEHPRVVRARRLVAGALAAAAPDEPVFAQVAAANAASLRALQPAGFAAVGAEVLFGPREDFLRRWTDGQVAVS
jgi:hypothetical protein